MHGRELELHPDDLEVVEAQHEAKKEVLENKDVSSLHCLNKCIQSSTDWYKYPSRGVFLR